LENVDHSISETADGIQCRAWIDDRRVATVGKLTDTECLDAELHRASSVRRHLEEGVRIECGADIDAASGEPLELERAAAAEHGEEDP
jgi:hypothetical protein